MQWTDMFYAAWSFLHKHSLLVREITLSTVVWFCLMKLLMSVTHLQQQTSSKLLPCQFLIFGIFSDDAPSLSAFFCRRQSNHTSWELGYCTFVCSCCRKLLRETEVCNMLQIPSGSLVLWFNLETVKTFSRSSVTNRLWHYIQFREVHCTDLWY